MPAFDYGDVVLVRPDARPIFRPGSRAWIVGVFTDRSVDRFDWLGAGPVYTIEFEDGSCLDVEESSLEPFHS